ncbi:MAG: carbamoyltransferase [Proteobacteria bacterium]|nr:carbamoyltransferase [Pseudomonadota bacterium]
MPVYILGISCFYHDSAAALLRDGVLVAAASEERFSRIKHDAGFPEQAINFVLGVAGITIEEVDHLGFYDKPMLKLERLLLSHLQSYPKSKAQFIAAIPMWMKEKLSIRRVVGKRLGWKKKPVLFGEHHVSHGASTFLCSPFEEAAILTVDGVGEWATTTMGVGRGNTMELLKEIKFPHSLGLLYSAVTGYLGFKVNSAEYKVMGLAPYGEPKYVDQFHKVLDIAEDGSFRLNMDFFEFDWAMRMCNEAFFELFGEEPRDPEGPVEQFHKDVARSVQEIVNEVMVKLATSLHAETGMKNLCMAGGVALNCVANGHVLRETPFEKVFIQPAAGDAGGALGVALWIHCMVLGNDRVWTMDRADWGPGFDDDSIEAVLEHYGAKFTRTPDEGELVKLAAEHLNDSKVVGWFQGRMEYGPRALGNRSILGDPRVLDMRDRINLKIKFREGFRPFAPSVLEHKCDEWFDLRGHGSPFMLLVADVHEAKRQVPAITHVDGSARVQTVTAETTPQYHALLTEFEKQTGCPMVINTSFNVRGEPIVCTPEDAFQCFIRTHMDTLVMGNFVLRKEDQREYPEIGDAREAFPLD